MHPDHPININTKWMEVIEMLPGILMDGSS